MRRNWKEIKAIQGEKVKLYCEWSMAYGKQWTKGGMGGCSRMQERLTHPLLNMSLLYIV
jgi:hypothetical protein